MGFRRTVVLPPLTSSQAALHDEVEQLLEFLRDRSNRDKLKDCQFFQAGSMLERWKWNSRTIRDEDLRTFVDAARELVNEIRAAELDSDERDESR